MGEHKFITAKDRTPKQRAQARKDAERWAKNRVAMRDNCDRCGNDYEALSPKCRNAALHEKYNAEAKARMESEEARYQREKGRAA